MKRALIVSCIILTVGCAYAETNTSAIADSKGMLTTNQVSEVLSLKSGASAQSILKRFGKPVLWGESNRTSESGRYHFQMDLTTNGKYGPLDFTKTKSKKVTWLYQKPGGKEIFMIDSCILLFFTDNKLDKIESGCLGGADAG